MPELDIYLWRMYAQGTKGTYRWQIKTEFINSYTAMALFVKQGLNLLFHLERQVTANCTMWALQLAHLNSIKRLREMLDWHVRSSSSTSSKLQMGQHYTSEVSETCTISVTYWINALLRQFMLLFCLNVLPICSFKSFVSMSHVESWLARLLYPENSVTMWFSSSCGKRFCCFFIAQQLAATLRRPFALQYLWYFGCAKGSTGKNSAQWNFVSSGDTRWPFS